MHNRSEEESVKLHHVKKETHDVSILHGTAEKKERT